MMTAQTVFIVAALLLLVAVLAILLRPLWRPPIAASAVDRRDANIAILRDQLVELERDRDDGSLAAADFAQARSELQRRLLDEALPETAVAAAGGARATLLALLVAIPLAATAGYLLLGQPEALDPLRTQARVSPQQIEEMVAKLADRLKNNAGDEQGWVMLARSYKALGRYAESADAYGHGGALVAADAALLADYAEVLARASGSLEGKPGELIARALKLDGNAAQALFLAGAAAGERNDSAGVVEYWGRLLRQLDPASEEGKSLAAEVDRARAVIAPGGGQAPGSKAQPGAAPREQGGKQASADGERAAGPEAVAGEVTLSGKVAAQAKPDDLLFVFARADEGSRMPLAVLRVRVAELPLSFRFDDTMALPGGRKISQLATLTIEARVAKSGQAQMSSGDLYGSVKGVKPGSSGIRVLIDQVQR